MQFLYGRESNGNSNKIHWLNYQPLLFIHFYWMSRIHSQYMYANTIVVNLTLWMLTVCYKLAKPERDDTGYYYQLLYELYVVIVTYKEKSHTWRIWRHCNAKALTILNLSHNLGYKMKKKRQCEEKKIEFSADIQRFGYKIGNFAVFPLFYIFIHLFIMLLLLLLS